MDMKIIKSEKRICSCCMEEHEVKTVLVMDQAMFKNSTVDYEASYFFCELAEELYMDEQQMQDNDIKLKDAYRKNEGLLTSGQIGEIRAKIIKEVAYSIMRLEEIEIAFKMITYYKNEIREVKIYETWQGVEKALNALKRDFKLTEIETEIRHQWTVPKNESGVATNYETEKKMM